MAVLALAIILGVLWRRGPSPELSVGTYPTHERALVRPISPPAEDEPPKTASMIAGISSTEALPASVAPSSVETQTAMMAPPATVREERPIAPALLESLRKRSESSPAEMAEWVLHNLRDEAKVRGLAEVIAVWAAKAPETALDWLSHLRDESGLEEAYILALRTWSERETSASIAWLQAHPDVASVENWATVLNTWAENAPRELATWFNESFEPALRPALLPALLVAVHDPAAMETLLRHSSPGAADAALQQAAKSLPVDDVVYARTLAERIQSPTVKSETYSFLARRQTGK